jgi:enoyl-CoA hydratase/carnithine racemase
LSSLTGTGVCNGVSHSRLWHRTFARVEASNVPVIAMLHGKTVGGGRSVRLPKVVGLAPAMDMMLTRRTDGAR